MQDYVEAIYHIVQEKHVARVKDISQRLRVKNSSVTGALHSLSAKQLINYTPYERTTLTPESEKIIKDIVRRHEMLQRAW